MSTIDVTSAAATTDEQSSLSRRNLLRLSMAGAGATVAGPVLARTGLLGHADGTVQQGTVPNGVVSGTAPMVGPKVPKFERELVVPPVIEPTETKTETVMGKQATVHYYDVVQKKGMADLLPAPFPATEIWGYNGIYPGPTFRQTQNGAYTVVRNTNTLPQSTSTHLHSSPTQPAHDGHPDDQTWAVGDKTVPGKSAYDGGAVYQPRHVYRYPNAQETRTLWYHDHGMHHTATNVYKGLMGFFIQDPDEESIARFGLDKLPSGAHDIPLVVADMQFDANGRPAYNDNGHDSLWGNVILVNGRAWPKLTVDRTK